MKKWLPILFVLLIFALCSCIPTDLEFYIFDSIEECEQMEQALSSEAEIHKLDIASEDSDAAKLQIGSSYAAAFRLDTWEFEIFAYEFKDSTQAQKYFFENTGKQSKEKVNYSGVMGMNQYRLIVIDNEKSYKITTKAKNITALNELISKNFSLKIVFTDEGITTQAIK